MKTTNSRVQAIDGIRGFSLLGILIANLLIFQYGLWGKDEIDFFHLSLFDQSSYYFVKIAVEGSFMPIFTFLFGYSLIMMKESLERKQLKVKRHLSRRFIFLIVLGLLHGTFLWEGDILFFYGLVGFILLLFLNRKPKTILIWGFVLFILTVGLSYGTNDDAIEKPEKLESYILKTNEIYSSGTYTEIMNHRNNEFPLDLDPLIIGLIVLLSPIFTMPMFLFGMYAANRRVFFVPSAEKHVYRLGAFLLIPFGLALKSMYYLFPEFSWTGIALESGNHLLALGYIALFALYYTRPAMSSVTKMFEQVGRLSMTNYMMQTVICTTIFYGYGFGLFGKLGVISSLLIAVIVFGTQVVFSNLYSSVFRSGPLETINRMWTYLSLSATRKPAERKSA